MIKLIIKIAILVAVIVVFMVSNMLQVKDYGVCSVGRIETKGESRIVSFGILGHVFTPGSDRLIQSTKTGDIKEELKSKVLDF